MQASECENSSDMNATDKNLNDALDATNNVAQDSPDTDNNKYIDINQGKGGGLLLVKKEENKLNQLSYSTSKHLLFWSIKSVSFVLSMYFFFSYRAKKY